MEILIMLFWKCVKNSWNRDIFKT